MDGKPFSAVLFNGEIIDGRKKISEMGIENGSTVFVAFGKEVDLLVILYDLEAHQSAGQQFQEYTRYQCSLLLIAVVEEVLQVYRSSGIRSCIRLIQARYMDHASKILDVLKEEIAGT